MKKKIQWDKDFGPHYIGDRDFLLAAVVSFVLLGLFLQKPILYILIGLLLVFFVINHTYDYFIGNKLYMESKRQTIRLFQGEQTKLSFELENNSMIPFLHGQFRFQIESILQSLDGDELPSEMMHGFQKSFSIKPKAKTIVEFPVEAKMRGVAKVRNISYTFPHLFNFNIVTLLYTPYYDTEVIVYPEILEVEGVETAFQMSPGEHRINLSPFEEIQSPMNTRNYEYSDPFYRINWKASAKTQQLQTNVYERVVDSSYVLIANVRHLRNGIQVNEEMEKILSYTTYICQQALEANVPYELFINAHTARMVPYLHLAEGEGINQYVQTLEMLARIPRHTMTYPFREMLYRVKKQVISPKTIIIIGEIPEESIAYLNEWAVRQKDIFHVTSTEDGATLQRWNGEVRLHA